MLVKIFTSVCCKLQVRSHQELPSLKLTRPLKIGHPTQKETKRRNEAIVFQPSMASGASCMLVSGAQGDFPLHPTRHTTEAMVKWPWRKVKRRFSDGTRMTVRHDATMMFIFSCPLDAPNRDTRSIHRDFWKLGDLPNSFLRLYNGGFPPRKTKDMSPWKFLWVGSDMYSL